MPRLFTANICPIDKQVGQHCSSTNTWTAVQVILLDVLMVDGLVERDDASGRVADEEDEDDGAQHQRLPVLVGRVLRVRRGGNGTCNNQKIELLKKISFLLILVLIS
jgi:hypothetical protein